MLLTLLRLLKPLQLWMVFLYAPKKLTSRLKPQFQLQSELQRMRWLRWFPLHQLNQQLSSTIVLVTHDDHVAKSCRRTITLRDGRIVEDISR